MHVPVVPSVGALLAAIGADFPAILAVFVTIGPPILPLLDTFRARGAGDQSYRGEKRRYKKHDGTLHPFGFQRDERFVKVAGTLLWYNPAARRELIAQEYLP